MPLKASAILIQSPDAEALARWYASAFELEEPKAVGSDHWGVSLANTYLGFDLVADPAGRGATSVWFDVADAHAACARLEAAGASVVASPDECCGDGETLARLLDPEGNAIGLIGPA